VTPFTIRRAEACDAETILSFVRGLAMEEKAGHEVEADPGQIVETMFSENSTCHAVICEESGRPIGFAVYFFNYSTWQGKNGLYIEDLYILPEFRNYGAGRKILKYLCNLALTKDCGRVEWSVLNWNTPAIGFYDALGAEPLSEWIRYRLSGKPLSKMGTL